MTESTTVPNQPEKKRDEDDDRAAFWWWFRRIGLLLLLLLLLFGIFLALFPAYREKLLYGSVRVATQQWGSSVVYPIEGKDAAGKHAAFDVAVLPKDLTWVRGSTSELTLQGQPLPATEIAARVFTSELREGLGRSKSVIAVGVASQEGERAAETDRAGQRARAAASWLTTAVAPEVQIWSLNLGQFTGTCQAAEEATDTGWQRPLIIVGVRAQDDGVNLSEAFGDAITGKSNLPSQNCYTNFDLAKFR
jgi:hypothetical protein